MHQPMQSSDSSPVAMGMTLTALLITSAARFGLLGPVGTDDNPLIFTQSTYAGVPIKIRGRSKSPRYLRSMGLRN